MPISLTEVGSPGAQNKRRSAGRLTPGDVVGGRYVIEEVLGTGGMGVVVAARHQALGHRVAMKFVSAYASAEAYARFSREARIIASIENDHVVRVVDYGMHFGTPYMAMDLLTGRDLGRELQMSGRLRIDEAADYIIEACDGLAAAHAKGVVHRDVKLANLFLALRADGERAVKLLDFGVSKLQAEACDDIDLTRTAAMIGSPLYMSPEQIRDPRTVDHRADIWSLGVVLHKLLTGQAPFAGQTTTALCAAVAADAPTALRSHAAELPERLEAIILCCLEKRPDRRYQNVASLARDLARFASARGRLVAEQLVARAMADGILDPSPVDARSVDKIAVEAAYASSVVDGLALRERRATWGWLLAIPVVVLVAGMLAFRVTRRPIAPEAPVVAVAAASALESAAPPSATTAAPQPTAPPPVSAAPAPAVQWGPAGPAHRWGAPGPRAPAPAAAAPKPHSAAAATAAATGFGGSALDDHH
jgi:serine/threonine-protein kinase